MFGFGLTVLVWMFFVWMFELCAGTDVYCGGLVVRFGCSLWHCVVWLWLLLAVRWLFELLIFACTLVFGFAWLFCRDLVCFDLITLVLCLLL